MKNIDQTGTKFPFSSNSKTNLESQTQTGPGTHKNITIDILSLINKKQLFKEKKQMLSVIGHKLQINNIK